MWPHPMFHGGFGIVSLLYFAFWLWMLIDCATKETREGSTKIVWVLIIIFVPVVGPLVYLFARKIPRGSAST